MSQRTSRLLTIGWIGVCTLVCGWLHSAGLFNGLERRSEDARLRRGPRPPVDPSIVIVEIDTASLQDERLGKAPWRPRHYAALLRRLKVLGAAHVALDVVLEHVYEPNDLELAREIQQGGADVVLASQWTTTELAHGTEERWTLPAREFRAKDAFSGRRAASVGFANLPVDGELVRDTWLFRRHPVFEEQTVASFATAAAEARGDVADLEWPPERALPTRAGPIDLAGAEERGAYCRIYYAGPRSSFSTVNVQQVMGLVPCPNLEKLIRGSTILVGATAPEYHDLHDTPMNPLAAGTERRMPGVEVHANVLNMLRLGVTPTRAGAWIAAAFVVVAVAPFVGILWFARPVLSVLTLPAWIAVEWSATQFVYDHWLVFVPLVGPAALSTSIWAGAVGIRWATLHRQQTKMRSLFSRCVHDSVVADLMTRPLGPALDGERRTVTVFFVDIRGFTSVSEQVGPERIVRFLREYFEAMCETIYAHHGAVDKFIGDAIMAFFGTPHDDSNHARHAVACAVAMQRRLRELQSEWTQLGLPAVSIGFGINTGPVVAGMLGSSRKMEYTVIGDTVNVASRLEALNKELGTNILMTDETRRAVGDAFPLESIGPMPLRGKSLPVDVYAVIDQSENGVTERRAIKEARGVSIGLGRSSNIQDQKQDEVFV